MGTQKTEEEVKLDWRGTLVFYCVCSFVPVGCVLSTETTVDSEQPGIQQAPHAHKVLQRHPILIAPAPVNTTRK